MEGGKVNECTALVVANILGLKECLSDILVTPGEFTSDTRWVKYDSCVIHEIRCDCNRKVRCGSLFVDVRHLLDMTAKLKLGSSVMSCTTNRNCGENRREKIVKIHSRLITTVKAQAKGASSDGGGREERK